MLNSHRITQSCSTFLLTIASSTFADERTLEDSKKYLNDLFEAYEQTCVQTGLITNLTTLLKSNTNGSNKECDARYLRNTVTSILSDTHDLESLDSSYRQWYEATINRSQSIINGKSGYSPSFNHKNIEKDFISSNVIKGVEEDIEPEISTARGYRTLHGD